MQLKTINYEIFILKKHIPLILYQSVHNKINYMNNTLNAYNQNYIYIIIAKNVVESLGGIISFI